MRDRETVIGMAVVLAGLGFGAAAVGRFVRPAHALHPKSGRPITLPGKDGDGTLLFNGWRITPAGRHVPTGDMLLGGAISPDGSTLAIANCGYGPHALHLIDIASEKEIARLPVSKAWNGIAWSPDGNRIYLSACIANPTNDIWVFRKSGGEWQKTDGLKLKGNDPKKTAVAGLALSRDGRWLAAANNSDNCLYILDASSGETASRTHMGDHPGVCKFGPDGKRLYLTLWGGNAVVPVEISSSGQATRLTPIATSSHPNDLAFSQDGRMFVSCGNQDEVSVIDLASGKTTETIKVSLTPKSPAGSTPNAVAGSPDGKALYVANADNNAVCAVDISQKGKSRVAGFIPTGWYPSALAVSPDGKKLMLCSGKGMGSHPNPAKTPINPNYVGGFEYIGRQLNGMVSFVDVPTGAKLAEYTKQVYADSPYRDSQMKTAQSDLKTAIPRRVGDPSPIKHVLYIIKENRTFDQVLGDMGRGNGDPSLCLFGRDVTPNHHALADQFVLLDNLYCSGEVSADGHPWCDSAYATDFTQRSWVLSYSAKGATVRSDSVGDPDSGYIWDACNRKGLSYRSYGEYVYATSSESAPEQKVAGAKGLLGHGSEKWVGIGGRSKKEMRDPDRADIFVEEFKEFERTNSIPRFMIMSLGENHTEGTKIGAFTPKAKNASGDQALGKIVDCISHSSAWKEFAIFVIEDDAQNGPDHVDSHRTCGLVISPYVKRGSVDSTMYNTCSMLRTMELILGLPPMTQHDAAATPMFASFTDRPDLTPFTLQSPRISLNDRNGQSAYGARESGKMDFSEYDRIDEDALNRILWHSIKGRNTPYPTPVRRAVAMSRESTR